MIGTLRHELFELCLSKADFSPESAESFSKMIVQRNSEMLLGCDLDDRVAYKEILGILPEIRRFVMMFTTFLDGEKNSRSNLSGGKLEGLRGGTDILLNTQSVYTTEESLRIPELGLKGNIDMTIESLTSNVSSSSTRSLALMGVELKTGHNQKPQESHMAQLALYTFMLRGQHGSFTERQDGVCGSVHPSNTDGSQNGSANGGVLLYLNHEGHKALHVMPTVNETKSLLGQRNQVAYAMLRVSEPRGVLVKHGGKTCMQVEDDDAR